MSEDPRATLVVFKEVVPGDLRKLQGEANDVSTGGGARDLRLPANAFRSIMWQIFDTDAVGKGGREIRKGTIHYLDDHGVLQAMQMEYWPPTNARPNEDRIARVHASPALGGHPPRDDKGRVFVLLTKFDTGQVRCDYAYEDDLVLDDVWALELRTAILHCMGCADKKNVNRTTNLVPAQGYYDFNTGTAYCHAE